MANISKGLFLSEPFMYKDPETGELRHIVEKLFGSFTYLFMGNKNRPIVHIVTPSKFKADELALSTYRAAKLADGWNADLVDKHIQRLSHPSAYNISDRGGEFVLKAINESRGPATKGDPVLGTLHREFMDGTENWTTTDKYDVMNPDGRIAWYLLSLVAGIDIGESKTIGDQWRKLPMDIVYSNYLSGPASSLIGTSECKWLKPVPARRGNGKVVIDGRVETQGYLVCETKDSIGTIGTNGVRKDGPLMAWAISNSAPQMFRGLFLHVMFSVDLRAGRSPGCNTQGRSMVSSDKASLIEELDIRVSADKIGWQNFRAYANMFSAYEPPSGAEGLPSKLPSRGYLVTMPEGLSTYSCDFTAPKAGTVLGVDGVIASRVWEEMVIGFPQLADLIEFQISEASDKEREPMEKSLKTLRDQPEGFVNLVQYAAMQPLPYDPLSRIMLEKFAQRADTSVAKEKMADEEKHAVTWGEANSRVNALEQDDYFIVINDPETQRLGFKVSPWIGNPTTHVLQFGNSAKGIKCRLALANGSVVGGLEPLEPEEALNYSQLKYNFTYDASLSGLQDPLAKVMSDYFTGFSMEDLSVPDPETGSALSPDSVLNQSLDISDCYENGSLFFPVVPADRRDMVALMNKGISQPENLRALLQQTSVAVFGAYVSNAALYPNLD